MTTDPGDIAILFTAFEPSGDDHAAVVITELLSRHPDLTVYAWGGSRMEAAGATIVERTGQDAVMGLPGIEKIREHQRINKRVAEWLAGHPEVKLHVPVDSPAANFPLCKVAKRHGRRVVHLVAPQVWAWGTWRIGKLRRLTDLVLCVLPFEEAWFTARNVPARFIGHPLFNRPLPLERIREQVAEFEAPATGSAGGLAGGAPGEADGGPAPKIALLPGSRPGEYTKNFGLLLDSFRELRRRHPAATGMVAATTPQVVERLKALAAESGGWPDGLAIVSERTDAVIHWCDLALVVSGTVTLQIARHGKPMVIVYRSNPLLYFALARWLLASEFLTLPNLIAGKEVVPELVPHFGGPGPLIEKADELITKPEVADQQRRELCAIAEQFNVKRAGPEAADQIERLLGLAVASPASPTPAPTV